MIQITFNEINTYKALKLYNIYYTIIPKEKLCILIIRVL